MADHNECSFSGRLGRDPDIKYTAAGKPVATFSLAVDLYARQGEEKKTHWQHCEAWEGLATTVEKFLTKGSRVIVHGRMTTDTWEKDGQKHSRAKLRVSSLTFFDAKPSGEAQRRPPAKPAPQQDFEDDIPF